MLKSMTGFGKASAENERISVDIELKSVNSRFLDTFFRLPNFLSLREFELKDVIKNKIKRGKINITLQVNFKDPKDSPWGINTEKLDDFLLTIKDIKKQSNINEELRLNHLLSNKDLFSGNKIEISEEDFEFIKEALNKSINELDIMKINEGSELSKDLRKRTKEIETKVDEIKTNSRDSVEENHSLFKERIKKLIDDVNINEERLETELAILADKADITEECVRLKSHLKFFNDSLNTEESNGRRLNFLCQEINREANTIASKTLSSEISHKSIFIKEEIEKIREQIQNIE
ncbi:MAG: YicC family protein [Bacteroidetes bacterium]|nr:YicC family protein [Bacteroidota bacterium]MCH8940852.1 YicC family protein [Bacteroidota bacterium]